MLKIRLQRVGRKHEPVFRLVLTESTNGPRSGKALEVLGSYDSRRGDKAEFQTNKIKEWMSKGVQLSPTVHNILVSKKVLEGKKINVLPPKVIEETKNKKLEAIKAAEEATRLPTPEVVDNGGQEKEAEEAEKAAKEAAVAEPAAEEVVEKAENTEEAPAVEETAETTEEAKTE